jgi:hypothetical protein
MTVSTARALARRASRPAHRATRAPRMESGVEDQEKHDLSRPSLLTGDRMHDGATAKESTTPAHGCPVAHVPERTSSV